MAQGQYIQGLRCQTSRNVSYRTDRGFINTSTLSCQWVLCHHASQNLSNSNNQGLVLPLAKTLPPQDPQAVVAFKNLKDKVQSGIQKYRGVRAHARPQRQPMVNDFSRLARRLCGKSVGVVLGGGGARGLSHIVSERFTTSMGMPILTYSCLRVSSGPWRNEAFQSITLPEQV